MKTAKPIMAAAFLGAILLGGAGPALASPLAQQPPTPNPDVYISSSQTQASDAPSPNSSSTPSDASFACHLHANTPNAAGGYTYIGWGAYNQCSGDGWYSGTVCARLVGESHTGGLVSQTAYKCKSGTAFTLSVQTETKCPSNLAYYYYTEATATENDVEGTQNGHAISPTVLGSSMCA